MKQTAVDWIFAELKNHLDMPSHHANEILEQAKAMHKEEILIAYDNGWEAGSYNPEQYYNEEYGK